MTEKAARRASRAPVGVKRPGFLSRFAEVNCTYGAVPHWEHPGVAAFVTFRLGDSLPQDKVGPVMERLRELREELRKVREKAARGASRAPVGGVVEFGERVSRGATGVSGMGALGETVAPRLSRKSEDVASRLRDETAVLHEIKELRVDFEHWLDAGHGECLFADPANRAIVEEALHHYDGRRFTLYAFVVMPNHVHVLFMPDEGETIRGIVRGLKHFISAKLAAQKTWAGSFWQSEYWDTLVRDEQHFARVMAYVKGNDPTIAYDAYSQSRSD